MSDLCLSDAYSALQSNIHFKMIRLMSFNIHDNSQEYHICMVPYLGCLPLKMLNYPNHEPKIINLGEVCSYNKPGNNPVQF